MLPLLPALLLLILQGPSSIEKMALDGRLPAALEAIHRQMEAQDHGSSAMTKADEAMLASLIALSGDPQVSHALIQLLSLGQPIAEPKRPVLIGHDWDPESPPPPIEERSAPTLSEGFAKSQRSRDGPVRQA